MPAEAVSSLAADPDVAYVSPDREVNGSLDYSEGDALTNTAESVSSVNVLVYGDR